MALVHLRIFFKTSLFEIGLGAVSAICIETAPISLLDLDGDGGPVFLGYVDDLASDPLVYRLLEVIGRE